jgi:hypothetical protein
MDKFQKPINSKTGSFTNLADLLREIMDQVGLFFNYAAAIVAAADDDDDT